MGHPVVHHRRDVVGRQHLLDGGLTSHLVGRAEDFGQLLVHQLDIPFIIRGLIHGLHYMAD